MIPEDELRSFLSENVTVVKPGETLIVLVDLNFTPNQIREYQDCLNQAELPFRVLLVHGEELGVFHAGGLVPVTQEKQEAVLTKIL